MQEKIIYNFGELYEKCCKIVWYLFFSLIIQILLFLDMSDSNRLFGMKKSNEVGKFDGCCMNCVLIGYEIWNVILLYKL